MPVAHHISREEINATLNPDIHSRLRDPKGPPSPTTLAYRLAELSPRPPNSSPLANRFFAPDPEEDNPRATGNGSDSPSLLPDDETLREWEPLQGSRKERSISAHDSAAVTTDITNSRQKVNQDDDHPALQDAVRGLFWLWKTRRTPNSPPEGKGEKSTEELDRAEFLQLVGKAIAAMPK